jgi:chromosome segregation ATPase
LQIGLMTTKDKPSKKALKKRAIELAERLDALSGRIDIQAFRSTKQAGQIVGLLEKSQSLQNAAGGMDRRLRALSDAHEALLDQCQGLVHDGAQLASHSDRLDSIVGELRTQLADLLADQDDVLQNLRSGLGGLASRGDDLEAKADDLASRVRGLEETLSTLDRAEHELGERILALETSAAELARHQNRLIERTDRLAQNAGEVPAIRQELAEVAERVQRLAAQADNLSTAVDGLDSTRSRLVESGRALDERSQDLEARLATLSEEGGAVAALTDRLEKATRIAADLAAEVSALSSRSQTLERKTEDLADQVHSLENESSERSRADTELADRARNLEATAAELTAGQAELREHADALVRRTDRLEEQTRTLASTDSDRVGRLQSLEARLLGLVDRIREIETGTGTSEGEFAGLTRRLDTMAEETQAITRTQSELADHALTLDSALDELNGQTLALADDVRALRPEMQGLMDEGLDALRRELRDLTDGPLQTRSPETHVDLSRLEAEDSRLDSEIVGIRARADEFEYRVGQLGQAEQELSLRVDGFNLQAEALERQIGDLQTARTRLTDDTDSLRQTRTAHEQAISTLHLAQQGQAERHQELTSRADGLASDLASLSERSARQDEAQAALGQRLDNAEGRQRQHTAHLSGLDVRVKRRSLIGGGATLLLAGGLVAVFLTRQAASPTPHGPNLPLSRIQDLQTHQQVLDTKVEGLSSGTHGLEETVDDLRAAVSAIDVKTEQILSRHVEEFNRLSEAIGALESPGKARQLSAEITRLNARVQEIGDRLTATETPQSWARAQHLGQYTIQLLGVRSSRSAAGFARRHQLDHPVTLCRTQYQGKDWYVLLQGIYETAAQARDALKQLPAGLAELKPWVRRVPQEGELLPL